MVPGHSWRRVQSCDHGEVRGRSKEHTLNEPNDDIEVRKDMVQFFQDGGICRCTPCWSRFCL